MLLVVASVFLLGFTRHLAGFRIPENDAVILGARSHNLIILLRLPHDAPDLVSVPLTLNDALQVVRLGVYSKNLFCISITF